MCGIGGILRLDGGPVDRAALERMRGPIMCRGPDDQACIAEGPCGLVHTRLAVLDPATGRQPMNIPGGREFGPATVIFNGEIYNHRELRRELERAGHRFSTHHSDTEVLLHGRRQWGRDLPRHLRGMFAVAIWDPKSRSLLLMRDRAGKKPLYFYRDDRQFCFASTPAAIIAALGPLAVRREGLAEYLALGYTRAASLWESIREVEPGTRAIVGMDGACQPEKYWSCPGVAGSGPAAGNIHDMLREAVESRLEADVPLGCFLSGGIDSSLVAALAQRALAQRGGRLRTFSVSMPDGRYDEGPWARRVADHIGAEHTELRAEPNVEQDLRHLIQTAGEPTGDSSILPTYWLSRTTRRHVTVALSGDGGDELFGGYERYVAMRLLRRHGWWLRRIPAALLGGYTSIVQLLSDEQLAALGANEHREPGAFVTSTFSQGASDPADAARRWDFENYLPYDLLRKVDRASMAVALEVRCPFLDTALVEAALTTPMKQLMPGRMTKPLLRDIARQYLPAEIVERKKMGFAVPIGLWFGDSLRPLLDKWLLDCPALTDLGLNRSYIEQLIREHVAGKIDHTHRLFALLTLAMWREMFKPQGG
jgi:asparagine synthase (glutamine-hydrolysing)